MMNEKLKDFFKKLIKDEAFREEFASAKTAYDGYTMAKPYIEGVSFDEFKDGLTYIHNKIEYRKDHRMFIIALFLKKVQINMTNILKLQLLR